MKRVLITGLLIIVVYGGVNLFIKRNSDTEPHYLTAPVDRGRIVSEVRSTGTVNALVTVEVSSQISGQVAELYADFNDRVEEDQPLARLDQRTFRAEMEEARGALNVAKAQRLVREAIVERASKDVERVKAERAVREARVEKARADLEAANRELARRQALSGQGVSTERDLDLAETEQLKTAALLNEMQAQLLVHAQEAAMVAADLQKARAELLDAQARVEEKSAALAGTEIQLERAVIRSPINGVVIGKDVDKGQTVAASLEAPTLFVIANDLSEMEVHAKVDEADIGSIHTGQKAVFTVDAFPDRQFEAAVSQVRKAPEVLENVVAYTVVLSTQNPDLVLLPGMTAVVRIVVVETGVVKRIPNAALRFQPPPEVLTALGATVPTQGDIAWILGEGGSPIPVPIQLGTSDAHATELVQGALEADQEVIISVAAVEQSKRRPLGLKFGF